MGTYSYFAVLPVHIVVTKMLFLNKTVFSVRGGEEWRVYRERGENEAACAQAAAGVDVSQGDHSPAGRHPGEQCSGSMSFWCGSGSADPCL
jgi:hypothetical protein